MIRDLAAAAATPYMGSMHTRPYTRACRPLTLLFRGQLPGPVRKGVVFQFHLASTLQIDLVAACGRDDGQAGDSIRISRYLAEKTGKNRFR